MDDTNLLRTLVNLFASDLATSVSHSGHMYAMMMACSSLAPASHLVEQFGGLSQVSVACLAGARKGKGSGEGVPGTGATREGALLARRIRRDVRGELLSRVPCAPDVTLPPIPSPF